MRSSETLAAEQIEELLELYVEERVVRDAMPDPRELCRDRPELLEPFLERVRQYEVLHRALTPSRDGSDTGRPDTDLPAGRRLLHYLVVGKIGEGGMGRVYVAEDTRLGRRVALKVLPPEMAADPEALERFRREARAVAALNHPHIVTLHSVEEDGGIHFLTMEWVEGTTLADEIGPKGMPLEKLFALAIPVADALAAAHQEGIVHRDLKPANVMVDAKGRVKILDFGLAKQAVEPGGATASREPTPELTRTGHVFGTVPYMSPEQLAGRPADARSDIFALGVILYEMATGRRPFRGDSSAELVSAILRDDPPSVTELNPDLPRHFGRIVRHCLEKRPDDRLQSALDVRNELTALRREVESGEVLPVSATTVTSVLSKAAGRWRLPAAAALVAAALTVGFWQPWHPRESPARGAAGAASPADRHALAVLDFDNLSGDPERDWLRRGIPDMLVTDLSQSPELEIVSAGRLHQILKDLDALDRPTLSFETMRVLADRGAVKAVVRGSYARAGEVLRIDLKLEETASGEILKTHSVAERDVEKLFGMVDELSAAIRNHFEVPFRPEVPATVETVTTSSLEAWHLFSEALALHGHSKRREAIALLEKAVEIDPDFGLALANLARLSRAVGHNDRALEYARRAVERIDRVPVDRRPEIRAIHYATRWATLGKAIGAFREALRLAPDRHDLRDNLAEVLASLERYDEAAREYETAIAGGMTHPGTRTALANVYAGLGRFETGYQTLSELTSGDPENWFPRYFMGWFLTDWGRLDEALGWFDRAAALPTAEEPTLRYGRWRTQVLREDWRQAELEVEGLAASNDYFARWRGPVSKARILIYRGRSREALQYLDKAIESAAGADAALVQCWKAQLLLDRGEWVAALSAAKSAQDLGRDQWPERKGLALQAIAHQHLKDAAEVVRIEEELRRMAASQPNAVEERHLLHLAGRLALLRSETEAAVVALRRAESLLPPEGVEVSWHVYPDHVAIWHDLGRAELAAGRGREALRWFGRAVTSGAEHLESPVPYVRSYYFLGRIHRQRGEIEEARRFFERFLELWNDGDLDREQVEEALVALSVESRKVD